MHWMKTGKDYNWVAVVHLSGQRPAEVRNDVHVAGRQSLLDCIRFDILNICKSLAAQSIFRDVKRCVTEAARVVSEFDSRRLRRRLGGK